MKLKKPNDYEARSSAGTVEVREGKEGEPTRIRGLAAVFDSLSENLGGFREIIAPGAFDDTDMSDVRGLFNHDANFVLGRTTNETLRLKQTKDGLEYDIEIPDTQTIRDLVLEPIRRGDVSQSSFGFIVGRNNDEWEEDEDGNVVRTIRAVERLFDVSPVTYPAYPDTNVAARCLEQLQEQNAERAEAIARREAFGQKANRLLQKAQIIGM